MPDSPMGLNEASQKSTSPYDHAARAALRAAERERRDEPVTVTLPRLVWVQYLRGTMEGDRSEMTTAIRRALVDA